MNFLLCLDDYAQAALKKALDNIAQICDKMSNKFEDAVAEMSK